MSPTFMFNEVILRDFATPICLTSPMSESIQSPLSSIAAALLHRTDINVLFLVVLLIPSYPYVESIAALHVSERCMINNSSDSDI